MYWIEIMTPEGESMVEVYDLSRTTIRRSSRKRRRNQIFRLSNRVLSSRYIHWSTTTIGFVLWLWSENGCNKREVIGIVCSVIDWKWDLKSQILIPKPQSSWLSAPIPAFDIWKIANCVAIVAPYLCHMVICGYYYARDPTIKVCVTYNPTILQL